MSYFALLLVLLASFADAQSNPNVMIDSVVPGWHRIPFPDGSVVGLSFLNADTGWVCGSGAFATSDGGNHWVSGCELGQNGYKAVHFFDAHEGWLLNVASTAMYHTTNGGQSWDSIVAPNYNPPIGMQWFGRDTCFVFSANQISRVVHADSNWIWRLQDNLDAGTITCISQFDSINFIALGYGYPVNGNTYGATVLRSNDGGTTWYRPPYLGFQAYFADVLVLDTTSAIAFGPWRTSDRGLSWKKDTTVPGFINRVSFLDRKSGFGVGTLGRIVRSDDSGRTWNYEVTNTLEDITGVQILDSVNAVAIGTGGLILKTNTGGSAKVADPTAQISSRVYPNPSRSNIVIEYFLPEHDHITLTIYSSTGSRVGVVLSGEDQQAGHHEVVLHTSALASGVYHYVLRAERYSARGRITIER